MSLFREDFKGLDIPNNKEATKEKAVEKALIPEKIHIPMTMHIGAPAEVEVSVGDKVKVGTLLGASGGKISSNIHSPVSGKVIAVEDGISFRGE